MRLGVSTQRFFLDGEEQEANGFKNVVLEDDSVDSRELEFDSFDKVPRKRRPLIAAAAISSALAFGVTAWMLSGGVPSQHAPQMLAARSVAAATPVPIDKGPVVEPIAADPTERVARNEPARPAVQVANSTIQPPAQPARLTGNPPQKARVRATDGRPSEISPTGKQPEPIRGFVWSPTASALVPIEGAASTETEVPVAALPVSAPNAEAVVGPGVGSAGLRIAPADTGPAPSETSRVPIEPPTILD